MNNIFFFMIGFLFGSSTFLAFEIKFIKKCIRIIKQLQKDSKERSKKLNELLEELKSEK